MLPEANLLFYTNLSGEVFYIITHRMQSQAVKPELQQRVYNDLAICICHPVVVQNLLKGSLRILEMSMTDIRTLMDRIVHSSIMTVNEFSMEKLFELTLIATRYQYTVCQHPKDILLIALNHLDGIRNSITDPTGIQLCENLHKIFIERFRGESSLKMQEYRFAVLTYLADVKLKMTNLIKLGFQKTSGEFVKDFPDKCHRKEFKQPGTIELFQVDRLDRSDSSDTSDSNNELTDDNINEDDEEVDDGITEPHPPPWMINEFGGESQLGLDDGCHFENISLQIHDHELQEDDELLEIEYVESSFHEVVETASTELNPGFIVKFSRRESREETVSGGGGEPLICSFDLHGSRGVTLGQSIYEIPGNSDEEDAKPAVSSDTKDNTNFHHTSAGESTTEMISNIAETDLDSVAIKAVHGLELCSVMLGLGNKNDSEVQYKSPLSNFRSNSPSATTIGDDGESLKSHEPYNIPFESRGSYNQSSSSSRISKNSATGGGGLTGINVVKFDARTDRSQNKAALSRISRELDIGLESFDVEGKTGLDSKTTNPFDFLQGESDE